LPSCARQSPFKIVPSRMKHETEARRDSLLREYGRSKNEECDDAYLRGLESEDSIDIGNAGVEIDRNPLIVPVAFLEEGSEHGSTELISLAGLVETSAIHQEDSIVVTEYGVEIDVGHGPRNTLLGLLLALRAQSEAIQLYFSAGKNESHVKNNRSKVS
jgi:hypothetical protein